MTASFWINPDAPSIVKSSVDSLIQIMVVKFDEVFIGKIGVFKITNTFNLCFCVRNDPEYLKLNRTL